VTNSLASQRFLSNIQPFPVITKHLTPSLTIRLQSEHWYENRIIRYVFNVPRGSDWICDLESTFREAKLDSVLNSEEIFGSLKGKDPDYDEKLFDALAEVRLVHWARSRGYEVIKKLKTDPSHPTPDFSMKRNAKNVIAEAKHFRVRDYLVYFVADRLEGLGLKTGRLANFGLMVETGDQYDVKRNEILRDRHLWMTKARTELSETWFSSLVRDLENNHAVESDILDGLFVVKCEETVSTGRVCPSLTESLSSTETVALCLCKLQVELMGKLEQIKVFMDTKQMDATKAIVFFSGIDQWQAEWDELWSTLEDGREQWVWNYIDSMRSVADALIKIPFELIVGRYKAKAGELAGERVVRYGDVQYVPFPRKPEDVQSQQL